MFVDEFAQEHSRDVEPMRGGHWDNYYYQTVTYIRRFKGARPPPITSAEKSIDLHGPFAQWADVSPEYIDDAGDTAHRDHAGYNTQTHLANRSGRNDFLATKVARDKENLYFYVRTKD